MARRRDARVKTRSSSCGTTGWARKCLLVCFCITWVLYIISFVSSSNHPETQSDKEQPKSGLTSSRGSLSSSSSVPSIAAIKLPPINNQGRVSSADSRRDIASNPIIPPPINSRKASPVGFRGSVELSQASSNSSLNPPPMTARESSPSEVEAPSSNSNPSPPGPGLTESRGSPRIHAFYYPWYANREIDGQYHHWNHKFLPHWDKKIAAKYPDGTHDPEFDDIGASFFPSLGAYSSSDKTVMMDHMQQMSDAGIGVAVVSWYPPGRADDNGQPWDALIMPLLDAAATHGMAVALHIEPYDGRSPSTVREDLRTIRRLYGSHPGLFRAPRPQVPAASSSSSRPLLPVVYIYDSYRDPASAWAAVFGQQDGAPALRGGGGGEAAALGVRGGPDDVVAIALLLDAAHTSYLLEGGFDGIYTYFGATGFTYGSTPSHWTSLARLARSQGKLFIPSVAPGYDDTRVRPWNTQVTRRRSGGTYFDGMFGTAVDAVLQQQTQQPQQQQQQQHRRVGRRGVGGRGLDAVEGCAYGKEASGVDPSGAAAAAVVGKQGLASSPAEELSSFISITSFNEWHEGTQIERAAAGVRTKRGAPTGVYSYQDYGACGENCFLEKTRRWVCEFEQRRAAL